MFFDNLHRVDWVILGSLLGVFLAQFIWYACVLCAPARRLRKERKAKSQEARDESSMPGVSVLLCAHNEGYNLSQYLPALLSQNYPTYEVIVVDDGSEDNTRDVVDQFMVNDPRLKMTFVPYGARVRSTKKLALTLAAKAAQYDYLLLTDADCVPESPNWIRTMMAGFEPSAFSRQASDIVLGFGAYFEEKGHVNRLVRYDTLFNGLHYLGAAICGHPYMGVGRNLAYRKSLFFETGGFSHQMTNRAGDDDLFVNHLATRKNTAVVLSRESYTWSLAKQSLKDWWQQKRRHISVSPSYRATTQWQLLFEPLTRGLFYAISLFAIVYYWPATYQLSSIRFPLLLVVGLGLLRWILQTAVINTSARRMGLRRFSPFTILWFDIILPLINLWMLIVPQKKLKW